METDEIEIPLVPHSIDMIVDEVLKRISPNVSKPPKDKSSNIYAYIIDVEDPDYQDYYRQTRSPRRNLKRSGRIANRLRL